MSDDVRIKELHEKLLLIEEQQSKLSSEARYYEDCNYCLANSNDLHKFTKELLSSLEKNNELLKKIQDLEQQNAKLQKSSERTIATKEAQTQTGLSRIKILNAQARFRAYDFSYKLEANEGRSGLSSKPILRNKCNSKRQANPPKNLRCYAGFLL